MAFYSTSGTTHMAFASSQSTPLWVIALGTTNHVTCMHATFTSYTSSPSLKTIRVTNDNHTKVLSEGTIDVNNAFSSNLFYVFLNSHTIYFQSVHLPRHIIAMLHSIIPMLSFKISKLVVAESMVVCISWKALNRA